MKRTGATVIIVILVLALIGGSFAFIFGSFAGNEPTAAGDVERSPELAASRGSNRTPELSAVQLTEAANSSLTAPADEPNPTTTTSSTSTTQAPSTTTTAPVVDDKPAAAEAESTSPVTAAPTPVTPSTTAAPVRSNSESGQASYYSHKPGGCAHKTIPKGTTVTVTNTRTGASASCVVNDRGPFVSGRIVDLDITVFKQIGSTSSGVVPVRISW